MLYTQKEFDLIMELGRELKKMYETASRNEQVAMVHVFAIKNGEIILKNKIKPVDIIKAADLQESYKTEISKGVKLSKFVTVRDDIELP